MGKVKRNKQSNQNKTVQSNNIPDSEERLPADSKEYAIHTILDQLQASSIEEKYCGLQTFAMLTESPENLKQIISNNVVKVAAPLLLDPANSVRNAAAGALRNLSVCGLEACEALMEQDTMTPLTCYFHQFAEAWVPDTASKTNNDDVDTFIQCVNLLWNLCESSELAIKYLGQSRILDILPRYLDLATLGNEIVASVLQCLFATVEDNPDQQSGTSKDDAGGMHGMPTYLACHAYHTMEKVKTLCEKQLEQLLSLEGNDSAILLIKTLASGVTLNTCNGDITKLPVNVINIVMSNLATTLAVDHRFVCNQLSSSVPLRDAAGTVAKLKGKDADVLEKQLKSVSQLLDAQQNSVEILANICSCDDGDESIEGDDTSDGDEDEMEELCNGKENIDSISAEDKLSPQVLEALVSLDIFDKIWARTQLPADNVMLILQEYVGSVSISKKLVNLQTKSLFCINNMLSSLPIENLGGINSVYKIWVDAGKLVFKQTSNNLNIVESATAVMRAALDKIKLVENNTGSHNLFNELALSDIEMMLTGIRECQSPEIRSNLIRMVGLLALLLVNHLNETTSNVICVITEFILEQAHKENEVWVLAEALDTIVDLFSEDETDSIAAKVKLVDKLAVLTPVLRNKSKQQRRLPKEYKAIVSTALSNVPRFIKYKKERISKL